MFQMSAAFTKFSKNSNGLLFGLQFSKYSTSTINLKGRSAWKGPYIDRVLLNPEPSFYKNFKIMSRASVVPMSMIGQSVMIHNGKIFNKVEIDRDMVGYKFGEFSYTRTHTHKEKVSAAPGKSKND